jgi:hypothetical protein
MRKPIEGGHEPSADDDRLRTITSVTFPAASMFFVRELVGRRSPMRRDFATGAFKRRKQTFTKRDREGCRPSIDARISTGSDPSRSLGMSAHRDVECARGICAALHLEAAPTDFRNMQMVDDEV